MATQYGRCPFCNAEMLGNPGIADRDFSCVAGHTWHSCVAHEHRIVEGRSVYFEYGCTCQPGKTWVLTTEKTSVHVSEADCVAKPIPPTPGQSLLEAMLTLPGVRGGAP